MVQIARAIEGVTINGKEYLLDNNGNIMNFENEENAILFLKENGFSDYSNEDFQNSFFFEEIEEMP